jgi:hypothetical protein
LQQHSSSGACQENTPATAQPLVTWPEGWLFQDTIVLAGALDILTQDLRIAGRFKRMPAGLSLCKP